MNPHFRACMAALSLAAASGLSSATVLSFDDLSSAAIPVNYGGLDWSAGGWSSFDLTLDPYTPHSGTVRAVTGFDATTADTTIRFGAPTTFQGAWFSGLGGATVTFEMLLGGRLVSTSALLDPSSTPSFLSSRYDGLIDAVRVSSAYQASFAMDDFTFAQPVPEPQTYALMLVGLAGVAHMARRRRRTAALGGGAAAAAVAA